MTFVTFEVALQNVFPQEFIIALYSQHPTLHHSPIIFQFCPFLFSSLLAPHGIFYSCLLSESIWGTAYFIGFSFDSARTVNGPADQFIPGTVWKLQQDLTVQQPIARKDQLDIYASFIDVTFDPSVSRPTTCVDQRHTLDVKQKWRLIARHFEILVSDEWQNICLACAHIYVGCDTVQI